MKKKCYARLLGKVCEYCESACVKSKSSQTSCMKGLQHEGLSLTDTDPVFPDVTFRQCYFEEADS